jgi:hypothetical protein
VTVYDVAVYNADQAHAMCFGFNWWVLGMWLALAYFIFLTDVSR